LLGKGAARLDLRGLAAGAGNKPAPKCKDRQIDLRAAFGGSASTNASAVDACAQ
jgi:hypothetical protein